MQINSRKKLKKVYFSNFEKEINGDIAVEIYLHAIKLSWRMISNLKLRFSTVDTVLITFTTIIIYTILVTIAVLISSMYS